MEQKIRKFKCPNCGKKMDLDIVENTELITGYMGSCPKCQEIWTVKNITKQVKEFVRKDEEQNE